MDLTVKKKPKLRPDYQVYSKLYYEMRVKDIALAQWPAERAAILEKKMKGEEPQGPTGDATFVVL